MVILGSTGSIGCNALEIARQHDIKIEGLSACANIELLGSQIAKFSPRFVALPCIKVSKELKKSFPKVKFIDGQDAMCEMIEKAKSKKILNAVVGFAGLAPTLTAIKAGKKVALANKESLVVGGKFIDTKKITPVDSEHFALWYLLGKKKPSKMIITASGGALRDMPLEELVNASVNEVLAHPNWSMGQKITVDSATMANKLLELLEARWLFGAAIEYDAIMEPSSTVHALLQYDDGVTTAQMSPPDMRLPIGYAMLGHYENKEAALDLSRLARLEFKEIDVVRYPLWSLKRKLLSEPDMGAVFNAANEVAVGAFLQNGLRYGDIARVIFGAIEKFNGFEAAKISELFEIDKEVRAYAKTVI